MLMARSYSFVPFFPATKPVMPAVESEMKLKKSNWKQQETNELLKVPAYQLGDFDVWGATAMILSELKDLCKNNL